MNFAEAFARTAAEQAERPAVKLDDAELTYAALDEAVGRAAGLLRSKGVGEGDRIGLQLPNVPYFPIVYFGALRIGAVVVTMNPLLKAREVAYYLQDSGARLLVASPDFADAANGGADQAVIIYTSGTTGAPKGATLMHSNLTSGAASARELVDITPDDVTVATL